MDLRYYPSSWRRKRRGRRKEMMGSTSRCGSRLEVAPALRGLRGSLGLHPEEDALPGSWSVAEPGPLRVPGRSGGGPALLRPAGQGEAGAWKAGGDDKELPMT